MKTVSTFTATIYCGLMNRETKSYSFVESLYEVCQRFCDRIGFCVSFTQTQFIYTNGNEPGIIVGIINYPRFPSDPESLKSKALELADLLRKEAKQCRVSVVFPNETIMIGLQDD